MVHHGSSWFIPHQRDVCRGDTMDCAGEDARDAMEMAVGAAMEAEISLGALDAMEMDQLISS